MALLGAATTSVAVTAANKKKIVECRIVSVGWRFHRDNKLKHKYAIFRFNTIVVHWFELCFLFFFLFNLSVSFHLFATATMQWWMANRCYSTYFCDAQQIPFNAHSHTHTQTHAKARARRLIDCTNTQAIGEKPTAIEWIAERKKARCSKLIPIFLSFFLQSSAFFFSSPN